MTEELGQQSSGASPVARNQGRNLNGGRSRSKKSTMDPLKKHNSGLQQADSNGSKIMV